MLNRPDFEIDWAAVFTPCMDPESNPASAEEWNPSRSSAYSASHNFRAAVISGGLCRGAAGHVSAGDVDTVDMVGGYVRYGGRPRADVHVGRGGLGGVERFEWVPPDGVGASGTRSRFRATCLAPRSPCVSLSLRALRFAGGG